MNQAVIVATKRTAFGKYGGTLKHLEPEQLLKPLFQHFKEKYPEVISKIDDVVLGNVVGNGGNIARKSLLEAGLKDSIPGVTIDRQCGSGLESVQYACRMIQARAGRYILQAVLKVQVEHLGKSNDRILCTKQHYLSFMSVHHLHLK